MAYTNHQNFLEMPTGAVDWAAIYNLLLSQLEKGRTIKLAAGEALAKGKGFYIKNDGKAWLADDTTACLGIWQSETTAVGIAGFGQVDGVMANITWAWTPGGKIYLTAAGVLTHTVSGNPIGTAISATEILIGVK
nr:hypothetical protein KSU1_C1519 [uncultured bacterium]